MSRSWLAVLLLVGGAAASADDQDLYRDPMRPYEPPRAEAGTRAPASYRLSTVLISSSRRIAVVNGQPCREGDWVDGAQVLAIEPRSVRLRTGSRELTVALARRAARQTTEGDAAP